MSDGEDNRSLAGWWTRVRRAWFGGGAQGDRTDATFAEDVVYTSKAVRRLIEAMHVFPSPVILDLGPVIGSNVTFLGEHLNCKVHLEDLFSDIDGLVRRSPDDSLAPFLATRLAQEPASVDAVLAWDVLDYLDAEEAAALVARLDRLLRPGGLVMAFFTTVLVDDYAYRKYIIEDADHLRHRRVPFARQPNQVWLGGDVERLFASMEVVDSYLLTHHQRETLLRRPAVARQKG
ncbi:MAG: class I SAM-dependent methyltransferase [Acidobacteria bacterium]|nr:class I SAM-dependent methyltransferase [Acidobacteriota bacterium]